MADDSTGLQSKQLQTASQRERFCGYRQMGNICYHLSLTGRDESEDQITHLPGMNDGMPLPASTRIDPQQPAATRSNRIDPQRPASTRSNRSDPQQPQQPAA